MLFDYAKQFIINRRYFHKYLNLHTFLNRSFESYKDDENKTIEDYLEEDLSSLKCLAMNIPQDIFFGNEFINGF